MQRFLPCCVISIFLFTSLGPLPQSQAYEAFSLPAPGTMVNLTPAFEPALIKGITVDKDNPFRFNFILDAGKSGLSGDALKNEGDRLVKYFFACLTIPEKDLWVNLSPYEKGRIIPDALGATPLGRDLLAQDYILKQLTASLIYPEKDLGKEFWNRVYTKARQLYGTSQIPVNTFNKVWILADKATVYEHGQTAFVLDGHLKVMLDEDYLALNKNRVHVKSSSGVIAKNDPHTLGSQIIRAIILPEIEKEVNQGRNFAPLRQIFNSLILASWYKKNLKEALLTQVYADKNTVKGINLREPYIKERIYQQYLQAYKKGVFNYIKEESSDSKGMTIPRKYFSGGFGVNAAMLTVKRDRRTLNQIYSKLTGTALFNFAVALSLNQQLSPVLPSPSAVIPFDEAMISSPIVSQEEQKVYTPLLADQIPPAFGANFKAHGLALDQFWLSEVSPSSGKLSKPSIRRNPIRNLATTISISSAIIQALAGASAPGTLEHFLGKASVKAGNKYGDEIDARAVKVGRESLQLFAELLDIVIIVGGNEGSLRDKSKDMPIGLVINHDGKNGVYMYFGDSVEVTNGAKRKQGRPGTSSMFTLVPLMMPSTDGYRISMAVDKYNPNKPFPKIDPVITNSNTLRHVLTQLADYMDAADLESFIREMAAEYKFATLDRPKHDQLKAQARELGFKVEEREDGDPLLLIRALLGVRDEDGKKLFVISTGGSNEHIMSMILAALYKKGLMTSTYAATETLKRVDRQFDPKGLMARQGSLEKARDYSKGDLTNYAEVNAAFDSHRRAGFNVPQAPVTLQELRGQLLTPDAKELDMLGRGKLPSSMVVASITGSNRLDWGVLRPYIQPVTWTESEDGSGKAVVSGFFINNEGKVYFFRASLKSKDMLQSFYSFIAANDLLPNPLITLYEKTRKPYMAMLEGREIDQDIISAHIRNIHYILREENVPGILNRLDDAYFAQQRNIILEGELVSAVREAERYILGDPTVTMEDGSVHHILNFADGQSIARDALRQVTAWEKRKRDQIVSENSLIANFIDAYAGRNDYSKHGPGYYISRAKRLREQIEKDPDLKQFEGQTIPLIQRKSTEVGTLILTGVVLGENDMLYLRYDEIPESTDQSKGDVLFYAEENDQRYIDLSNKVHIRADEESISMDRNDHLLLSAPDLLENIKGEDEAMAVTNHRVLHDNITIGPQDASNFNRGGIDLNASNMTTTVRKEGAGVETRFNAAMAARIRKYGIESLTPVIYKITPIRNIWPMFGMQAPQKQEKLAEV